LGCDSKMEVAASSSSRKRREQEQEQEEAGGGGGERWEGGSKKGRYGLTAFIA